MIRPFFILLITFATACKPDALLDCVNSTGPLREEKRAIGQFENLIIESDLAVTWHDSTENLVIVRCGRNLLRKVRTELVGKTLLLTNENRCNWVRSFDNPMHIDLYSKAPYLISLKGFGDISCEDTLKTTPLTVQHYGTSNVLLKVKVGEFYLDFNSPNDCEVSGESDKAIYSIQRYGKFKAQNMSVHKLILTMKGENDAWISVKDSLKGSHESQRNVYLKGNPSSSVLKKSSGWFIPN